MNMHLEIAQAEAKVKRFVFWAIWAQCLGLLICISMFILCSAEYRNAIKNFSCLALFSSFVSSRIYIRLGKTREHLKGFSTEESSHIKNEYFLYFFLPYIIWSLLIWSV